MLLSIYGVETAWNSRVTRLLHLFYGKISTRHARFPAGGNNADAITGTKFKRIAFLNDCDQLPIVHLDGNFHRLLAGHPFFNRTASKTTSCSAASAADDAAAAAEACISAATTGTAADLNDWRKAMPSATTKATATTRGAATATTAKTTTRGF